MIVKNRAISFSISLYLTEICILIFMFLLASKTDFSKISREYINILYVIKKKMCVTISFSRLISSIFQMIEKHEKNK